MQLTDIIQQLSTVPAPWSEGRTIPWGDPEFSRRMLAVHLSQGTDGASRRFETIDKHVDFIRQVALPKSAGRVLDLGCGPGLYTQRLAQHGFDCTGIDLGPASIEYAVSQAAGLESRCRYILGDLETTEFGSGYKLIMLLYGDFNPFPRANALQILRRCHEALAPDGRLLLEVHTFEAVKQRGEAAPRWSAHESGLFSDRPHLRLEQQFWHEDSAHAVGRYWIVDAETGDTTNYGWSMRAYNDAEYEALLDEAGLKLLARYDNLMGTSEPSDFQALLAARA